MQLTIQGGRVVHYEPDGRAIPPFVPQDDVVVVTAATFSKLEAAPRDELGCLGDPRKLGLMTKADLRLRRASCDWLDWAGAADAPDTPALTAARVYRQALRDVTKQNPNAVTWPVAPE